jgi:hypothetical protein
MKNFWTVSLFCCFFSFVLAGQASPGAVVVTGSVTRAVSLSSTSLAQNLGAGAIRVNVQPSADGSQTVTLLVRGNSSYSLSASLANLNGAGPGAAIGVTPLTTAPTGPRAIAQTSAALSEANLGVASGPAVILTGSRISRGGNDLTPDNALAVQLRLDFPVGATDAVLTFRVTAQQ